MTVIHKKIFGTGVLAIALVAALFVSSGTAQALYRYVGSDFRGTGEVTQVGSSSFELTTSGSTWPFTMVVDGSTNFGGGYGSLTDVAVGDEVRVAAERTNGDFNVRNVRKIAEPDAYGNGGCDAFVLRTGVFERPVGTFFYVIKDGLGVKVNYSNDTRVVGGRMADVLPGTEIVVSGEDCRSTSTLTADTIRIINNEALAACQEFGRNAIVVRNYSVLLANDAASAQTALLRANVPAGRYNVYGVSYDNHADAPWDKEIHEQWRAKGYNASGTEVISTGATNDLPNGINFNTTRISQNVNIAQAVANVRLVHAVTPGTEGYQSIYPVCVAFVPTARDDRDANGQVLGDHNDGGKGSGKREDHDRNRSSR